MHSSQNEQDNRNYAKFAKIPMLEPSDSQEAYDFVAEAFALSEEFDTPVMLRTTTRVSHGRGQVVPRVPVVVEPRDYARDISKYVMVPQYARQRNRLVLERLEKLRRRAEESPLNVLEAGSSDFGIIASGIAYTYAREAFPKAWFLKLGMSHPLPYAKVARLYEHVSRVAVVEELDPFFEEQVRALGLPVIGKAAIPADGELDQEAVFRALEPYVLRKPPRRRRPVMPPAPRLATPPQPAAGLPVRPPVLCPGCSHRSVYSALRKRRLAPMGDIGCYTLGALPPLLALDSCLCMGASIGMMAGFNKALGKKAAVGVIGDSTFFHSGVTPLIDAFYNEVEGMVVILDNRTTAMTGHQGHPGTGLHPDRAQGPDRGHPEALRGHRRPLRHRRRHRPQGARRGHQGRGQGGGPRRHHRARSLRAHDARAGRRGRGRRGALQPLRRLRRSRLPGDRARRGRDLDPRALHRLRPVRRGVPPRGAQPDLRRGRGVNGTTTVSIVGVGGQGVLLGAAILAETASGAGLEVKASEVKGMAQRGGSVLSTVRFGEHVWSPVGPHADVVIATELLEGIRGLDLLGPRGTLVCAYTTRITPGSVLRREEEYPEDLPGAAALRGARLVTVDAEGVARAGRHHPRRQRRAARRRLHGPPVQRRAVAARPRGGRAGEDPRSQSARVRARARRGRQPGGRVVKVTQLTVFLENRSGRLAEVADILGQAGINIRGFSTTEAAEYGIVRLIVTDPDRARQLLHDAGFTTHFSEVLCVKIEDVPGGLAEVLDQLAAAGVSIDYLYSISFWNICFAVRDIDRAVELLAGKVTLLSDEEVRAL